MIDKRELFMNKANILILLDFANTDAYPLGMKSLKDSLRKTLAHRHLWRAMVGAVALNTVRNFLISQGRGTSWQELGKRNEEQGPIPISQFVDGYVSFNVFFLKVSDQALKIQVFKQKNQILQEVNLALEKIGYKTRIEEIRMKT